MATLGNRISHIRKALGLSQEQFAKKIGLQKAQSISRFEKNERHPRYETLIKIANLGNVSHDWLMTGKEPQERKPESIAFVNAEDIEKEFALVPRREVYAGSGGGAANQDTAPLADRLAFRTDWIQRELKTNPKSLALVEARGDSMEPLIGDRDLILFDTSDLTPREGIYVIMLEGEIYVKRLQPRADGSLLIISENKEYPPDTVGQDRAPDLVILGRVVWIGRRV